MSIEKIPAQVDRPIACTYFATNLFMQKVSFSVSPSPLVMYSSTASSHLHLLPFQNKDSVRFVDEGFRNVSQKFSLLDFCRSEDVSIFLSQNDDNAVVALDSFSDYGSANSFMRDSQEAFDYGFRDNARDGQSDRLISHAFS